MKSKPEILLSQTLNSTLREDLELETKIDKMEALGLEYIGEGLDRVAYAQKDLIVKICKYYTSHEQVKHEVETYQALPDKSKKYFNKPLAYSNDFSWIIFKRAKVEGNGLTSEEAEIYKVFLEEKLRELHLYPSDIGTSDIHSGNIGVINNKPIIIDYGI